MNSKINILHINNNTNLGGQQQVFMNIAENLDKDKYNLDLLVYDDSGVFTEDIKKMGVNIIKISSISKHFFRHIRELVNIYKNGNYDVVHQHASNSGIFINVLIAKKMGVGKVIVHSHCEDILDKKKVKRIFNKLFRIILVKYSDFNIACSDKAGYFLFGKKSFQVISNGVDLKKFSYNDNLRKSLRRQMDISDSCFVLGNVGRLSYVKNQKFLVDVFKEYRKINKNSKLILVGDGSLKDDLVNYVKKNELFLDVIFLGNVKNVNDIYNVFDVFLFPSFSEGQGICVLEALANGLLCISNNTLPKIDYTLREELDVNKWLNILKNNNFERKQYDLYNYSNKLFLDKICNLYGKIKDDGK